MHILLIHPYFLPPQAAGSTRWNQMTQHWAEAGHQITVLAGTINYFTGQAYDSGQLSEETSSANIRVVRVRMSAAYNRGRWGRLWAYWTFFWNCLRAAVSHGGEAIDVVLASSPPLTSGLTGWLLALRWRKPWVLEIRDLWPDAPVQLGYLTNSVLIRLAYWLERFLYRQADHIVTLTPAFEQRITQQNSVAPKRCTTISNGADLILTQEALAGFDRLRFRQQHGLEDRCWVIYAGSHGIANGLGSVIDAAMTDRDIGFLLLGDGPAKAMLQAEVIRRGLTNVRFLPAMPKPETLRWIAAADAGLVIMQPLPVVETMLSAKLFDYCACGKPVFTAIDGLTRQLVEQQQIGFYLDPSRPDLWTDLISVYFDSPSRSAEDGYRAALYARSAANRSVLAHRYLTILTRVQTVS